MRKLVIILVALFALFVLINASAGNRNTPAKSRVDEIQYERTHRLA